jgi:hypothetical protein
MLVNLNGYTGELPEDRIKVAIPKEWLSICVCYETYQPIARWVVAPKECNMDWRHMPDWAITDPYKFEGWFLFKDQFEELTFSLRYL